MAGCLRIAKESVFTGLNNYRTDFILSYDDEVYFDLLKMKLYLS